MTLTDRTRINLCLDSLHGLSVGDALGAQFFTIGPTYRDLAAGRVPDGPWPWTDDTQMACSVVTELHAGGVDQDRLAANFAERCDPYRGYGVGAVVILHQVRDGRPWRAAAGEVFGGQGSCGNGAAMRIAPLGAYHAGGPDRAAEPYLVPGECRRGLRKARTMLRASVEEAAYALGNGERVTAQDTVPFALWVAARHLDDYPAAVTACVAAGGDVDTTGAIVGGIVAAYTGVGDREGARGIPPDWLDRREPLPGWVAWPAE